MSVTREIFELIPIDWKKVRVLVQPKDWNIATLKDLYEKNVLHVRAEIQRGYVWSDDKASRWIETLINELPAPPIIAVEICEGKYLVVDGVQRLTSIIRFLENKLKLDGVSDLRLKGKTFEALPEELRNKFMTTCSIRVDLVQIVAPDDITKYKVILDIFRRLNLGAAKMNFVQVIFCSLNTPLISRLKEFCGYLEDISKLGEITRTYRELFSFTPREVNRLEHYIISLAMALTIAKRSPYTLYSVERQECAEEILQFVVQTSESEAEKIIQTLSKVIVAMKAIGLSRRDFVVYRRLNRIVIAALTLALVTILEHVKFDISKIEEKALQLQQRITSAVSQYSKHLKRVSSMSRKDIKDLAIGIADHIVQEFGLRVVT